MLADPEVREGVKKLTAWPTIPQIFIDGEFVGGPGERVNLRVSP